MPKQLSLPGIRLPKKRLKRKKRKKPPRRRRQPPAPRKKPYPHPGIKVNPGIRMPGSPAEWVDAYSCDPERGGCGSFYEDFKPGITWDQGLAVVRRFPFKDARGPVLWAMRSLKMELWFEKHRYCGLDGQWDLFKWGDGYYESVLQSLGWRLPARDDPEEEDVPF